MFEQFSPLSAPLAGCNIIEASAGTGKTYTISCLVVRALAAWGIDLEKILLVTFTNAACAELQQAVRAKMQQARKALTGEETIDTFAQQLAASTADAPERRLMVQRLEAALGTFDLANIFTIHGFCQRMLHKYAFESGAPFGFRILEDERELLEEIAHDYWRLSTYPLSGELNAWLDETGYSVAKLLTDANNFVRTPQPTAPFPPAAPPPADIVLQNLRSAFREARLLWSKEREDLLAALLEAKLHQRSYSPERLALAASTLSAFFAADFCSPLPAALESFCPAKIAAALTKSSQRQPSHPFFDAVAELLATGKAMSAFAHDYKNYLSQNFFCYLYQELEHRKREGNLISFSDMLTMFYRALCGETGDILREKIAKDFLIAFVDEFQDTDAVQGEIFRMLFGKRALFLVGDPKQSIYAFRGADINEYLRASQNANKHYYLKYNWRSHARYVEAVNTLFSQTPHPFGDENIAFQVIEAGSKNDTKLLVNGEAAPPFALWYLESASAANIPETSSDTASSAAEKAKTISKDEARLAIAKAVATSIAQLCQLGQKGRAIIGAKGIQPQNIAVLVPKRHEVRLIQRALAAYGVPCVTRGIGNVFASREAWELWILLSAIRHNSSPQLVRAALATSLMGYSAREIAVLTEGNAWNRLCEQFARYRTLWHSTGLGAMLGVLISEQGLLTNIANGTGNANAERRLTDFWHIVELLTAGLSPSDKNSPSCLLRHWERQISASKEAAQPPEAANMRLESDEFAVQIATIHASKGLEYDIVFCPFLWDAVKDEETLEQEGENEATKHPDKNEREAPQTRIGDAPGGKAAIRDAKEGMRLLYVALTRAKYHCCLVAGDISGAQHSPLARLFIREPRGLNEPEDTSTPRPRSQCYLFDDFSRLAQTEPQLFSFRCFSPEEALAAHNLYAENTETPDITPAPLSAKEFKGVLDTSWHITSFSALTGELHFDTPDYDSGRNRGTRNLLLPKGEEEAGEERLDIFSFPHGVLAGNFFHALLADIDFTASNATGRRLEVAKKLREFGIATQWHTTVLQNIETLLAVPLPSRFGAFPLREIPRSRRLEEMEFCFELATISPEIITELANLLASNDDKGGDRPNLNFSAVRGFMKGFIDVVFERNGRYYLLDWKSNHLGNKSACYNATALRQEMMSSFYNLQCLIYTVALHLFLKSKIPDYDYEKHFGEAFYIFIRGIEANGTTGIWHTRPSLTEIEKAVHLLTPAISTLVT